MLDDPTPAFLKLCIQLLSNRNAVDESGDLDPDVCSSIYTICRILSHHEPVPRGIAALSCCYCIATVSFQSAPLDHTMFGMRAPELCELMKSGDPSNTLDVVTSFMDADGGVIFSLPPEDRKMVAEIEETLWSGYKRSIVHKSKCISILAEVDEWKEICKFMSSSPFPHTWGGRDETLPCAIHGVSIPGGVFQLLCNSSPTRPGVGSLRQQGGEVEGPLAKDIHRCFRDKSPAIRRSRHDRQWVEGEASTFCSCAQCQTCALGCGRRSIHHIVGRVYSSLESTDDADDVVVPLGRILWRVAWKKILFVHPRVSLCSEMFDASVANVTFRSEVGIIELEDKWVHLVNDPPPSYF